MARNSWATRLATALLAVCWSTLDYSALSADQAEQPAWNVLLRDWQVVGPFAKPDKKAGGPELELIENETEISPANPANFQGAALQWKAAPSGVIDFATVLQIKGKQAEHSVAYARTEFTAPRAMRAKLSLGFDDSLAVWLNGEEVFRNDMSKASCRLDQKLVDVELREGLNTLLLKVGQATGGWAAMARLLPTSAERPLGYVFIEMPGDGRAEDLPTLTFELLNQAGETLATQPSDGFRLDSPSGIGYAVHFADAVEGASRVRVRGQSEELLPVDHSFTMDEFAAGTAKLKLQPAAPLEVKVVDAKSGAPVKGATFQFSEQLKDAQTGDDGQAAIDDYPALTGRFWVAAPGYLPKQAAARRVSSGKTTVKLTPGGHVLKGRVLSQDGKPLPRALVRAGWSGSYEAMATSDDEGRFEVAGISPSRGAVSPTIVCEGFVAKDGFSQKLAEAGETEVEYRLEPGAVVVGRVVNKETGAPAPGITVTTGHDRFVSNLVNPAVKTDADGVYRLTGVEPGANVVHAFSDDYAPAMAEISAQVGREATANFEIEPGGDVVGKVVDPQGRPLDNVWIVTDTWNGARMFKRETRSAKDGSFRLAHMPSTPAETHVMKQDYVSNRNFQATPGEHELVLKPVLKHRISFQLSDTQQPPAANQLSLQKGYQFPGNDRISWHDESYLLRQYDPKTGVLTLSDGEPSTAKISWRFRVPGYVDATIDDQSDAVEAQKIDLVLQRAGAKRGVVVAADDGVPLRGVHVLMVNKQDRFRPDHYVQYDPHVQRIDQFTGVKARTNDRGEFELPDSDQLAESSIVLLSDSGWAYLENAEALLTAEPCELPMPLGGVIEGVASIAGEPERNADIQINWIPPNESEAWDLPWGCGGECTTDAAGRFRFEGLGPGRYRIARSRGFESPGRGGMSMHLQGEEIVLRPGETLKHRLARAAGHHVQGVTVGPNGQPLGECTISATRRTEDKQERIEAVRADAEGRFTIAHLPAGSYELSADHYATTATSTCGLGEQDYSGRVTVKVPAEKDVTLKLTQQSRGALTNAGPSLKDSVPPDFTATPLDGSDPFTLSEQWGKVVAIDFWATWCGPCMAVMPQLKELHEKYKDSDDVIFITVSLDEKEEDLRKVMEREGLEFPVFFAGKGWADEISKSFGVTSIPSSFVIGRDGRFAADKLHGAQLAAAVAAAVAVPPDQSYAAGAKPARLTVTFALEGCETAPPGVKLQLKATGASGKTVREDSLTLAGQSSRIVWLYPPLEGGKIEAVAEIEGVEPQTLSVEAPQAQAELAFTFKAPRQITGTVMAETGKTPASGMTVTATRGDGFQQTTEVAADGEFVVAALPGTYRITLKGNDKFAPLRNGPQTPDSIPSVEVTADNDPDPVALKACRTIAVTGVLVDADDKPLAGAEVMGPDGARVPTDKEGKFTLEGAPSEGEYDVYGISGEKYGRLHVTAAEATAPLQVKLGEGMSDAARRGGVAIGQKAPTFEATDVASAQTATWKPSEDRETLVVFGPLWHPTSRELLKTARQWSQRHDSALHVMSCDWSLAQAKREADKLGLTGNVWFGGPGGTEVREAWGNGAAPFAALIARDGKISTLFKPGELKAN